ncbi:MAG: hypothetical protein C0473_02290 [Cyanobacteria bacterium DS3.002]|nr:hypothetical protein [Cyanobacteria bacterium DS3.002]MBA4049642.1 hypothetical protein [Cyanobacteria bacterium DS2.008]MBA4073393.1 hypothetical protein [Cyanobacteria bacterium PR.023]
MTVQEKAVGVWLHCGPTGVNYMIWDSVPWKKQLGRSFQKLTKWQTQTRWTESTSVSVEKEIFFALYAIRKLLDAQNKLSFECRDKSVSVTSYPATAKKADLMNWHKLDLLYDFGKPKRTQVSLRALCNSMVHSFVFMPCVEETGLIGIFFNTDRDKSERLYSISIDVLKTVFERVINDDVVHLVMLRNSTGDFDVVHCSKNYASEYA